MIFHPRTTVCPCAPCHRLDPLELLVLLHQQLSVTLTAKWVICQILLFCRPSGKIHVAAAAALSNQIALWVAHTRCIAFDMMQLGGLKTPTCARSILSLVQTTICGLKWPFLRVFILPFKSLFMQSVAWRFKKTVFDWFEGFGAWMPKSLHYNRCSSLDELSYVEETEEIKFEMKKKKKVLRHRPSPITKATGWQSGLPFII